MTPSGWGEQYSGILSNILNMGDESAPRGMQILELLHTQFTMNPRQCIFDHPVRNLNYRFMLAEYIWIWRGQNDLQSLLKFNSRYGQFSDDGRTLAGAYGPRLQPQWDYILQTLQKDPDSRQAVASIWTPNPAPSRDIPCTLSAQFLIRKGVFHSIWTMRSSDAWLGIPYDVFSFSMIHNNLALMLCPNSEDGTLTLCIGSSHIYREHWSLAELVIADYSNMKDYRAPRCSVKRLEQARDKGGKRECLRDLISIPTF